MYLQHFSLNDQPFRIVPSPRFFFVSETHDEGRARILYGIRESRGFVVVTGGVGLGKTTVLLSVINEIETDMDVAVIVNPIDSFSHLLKMICEDLGIRVRTDDEAKLLARLNKALLDSYAKGRGCVLLLDEAQNLSIEVLEKVRTLSNLQTEEASLLQIVLVGQPELTAKLNDVRLRQLRQRIGVWHEIRELDEEDTADYIWHRLALSGAPDPRGIVERRSANLIHKYALGIPRLINQIADTALVVAYGQGRRHVEFEHVREAARELRLDEDSDPMATVREPKPEIGTRGESRPAVRRRWLIAAVICIVLVLLTGAAWTRFGSAFGPWPTTDAATLSAQDAQPVETVSLVEPAVDEEESTRGPAAATYLDGYGNLEALNGRGAVHGIYLTSFLSEREAREFAGELVLQNADWPWPLFVTQTWDRPPRFQLIAGGFSSQEECVDRAEKMKLDLGLGDVRLTRLTPAARPLYLDGVRNSEAAPDE
jgi:general secretion pathway protein A